MGCLQLSNKIANMESVDSKKKLEEYDRNVAVDYALQGDKNNKISQIELMVSCKNLPNLDPFKMPNTMAVLYFEKNS